MRWAGSKGMSRLCCSSESGTIGSLSQLLLLPYTLRGVPMARSWSAGDRHPAACATIRFFIIRCLWDLQTLEHSGQISIYQLLLLKLSNHFGCKQSCGRTKLHPQLTSLWSLCGILSREKNGSYKHVWEYFRTLWNYPQLQRRQGAEVFLLFHYKPYNIPL